MRSPCFQYFIKSERKKKVRSPSSFDTQCTLFVLYIYVTYSDRTIDSMYNWSDEWYFNILHVPPIHSNRTMSATPAQKARAHTYMYIRWTHASYKISKTRATQLKCFTKAAATATTATKSMTTTKTSAAAAAVVAAAGDVRDNTFAHGRLFILYKCTYTNIRYSPYSRLYYSCRLSSAAFVTRFVHLVFDVFAKYSNALALPHTTVSDDGLNNNNTEIRTSGDRRAATISAMCICDEL